MSSMCCRKCTFRNVSYDVDDCVFVVPESYMFQCKPCEKIKQKKKSIDASFRHDERVFTEMYRKLCNRQTKQEIPKPYKIGQLCHSSDLYVVTIVVVMRPHRENKRNIFERRRRQTRGVRQLVNVLQVTRHRDDSEMLFYVYFLFPNQTRRHTFRFHGIETIHVRRIVLVKRR